MAECAFCGQDMGTADSCEKNVILYPTIDGEDGGSWYFAIPYGEEERGERAEHSPPDECHDCGVVIGGYHHPGCDVEESPFSGGQLIMEVLTSERTEPYHARAASDPHRGVDIVDLR